MNSYTLIFTASTSLDYGTGIYYYYYYFTGQIHFTAMLMINLSLWGLL